MKALQLTSCLFFLSLLGLKAGIQATLFVSPNGSGTDFSQAHPGDLMAARDQIRTISTGMTGDIIVYLYGGIYQLTNGFQLQENATNHDSGTGGYNIIYEAYPGAVPVFSGSLIVTNWSLYNVATNIWRAYVGTNVNSRQFYVNGLRAIRARSAMNPPGFTVTGVGFTSANIAMQTWGNVTNIELMKRSTWKQVRCPIASISGTAITMQMPGWGFVSDPPVPGIPWAGGGVGYTGSPRLDSVTWIENAYELLTYPGMWYLNRATGYLYYIPRPGENMATATAMLPLAEKLVDASGGSLTTPIHNLVFSGITFEGATWLLPSTGAGYADNQTSILWSGPTNALKTLGNISFQTARNIQVTNDTFLHMGGSAVDFGTGAHNNVVVGNHIEDVSACGITLGEVTDYATSNTNQMTDGNVIRDNYIRSVGVEYEDAIGIWVGYARNTLLGQNDIANTPYTGISVGWGWGANSYSSNNQVNGNYVADVMQTLYDGGSFYTLSEQSNSWVIGNYFKDSCLHGIYWDEGTAYYTAISNVVDNCAGAWVNIWTGTIHNNIATNNYSNVNSVNNSGTDCLVTNTTYVAGQNWPAPALAIIQNAGLESNYASIQLPGATIDDEATNCAYHGDWNYLTNSTLGDYNGDVHVTTNAGDYVDFTFYGTGVSAVCRGDTNCGNVDVYLDGVYQATVSGNRAGTQPQQTLFSTNNLSVQTHILRLVNDGEQNAVVDAFVVRGVPEIIVNDDVAVYDHVPSDWTYSPGRDMGDYHSDVHYTQNNGEYVQYSFVGPYIVWLGEAENSESNVDVYLDGVYQKTVNCYSTTRITQQRLFTATNLSPGRHSIKLIKDSGSYMVLDAFAVTPTAPAPPAPTGLVALGGTNQVNLSWTGSPAANGYNVKRATVGGGPYTVVASPAPTNYNDPGLIAGTTYYYVVSATNISGESANSAEAAATTVPLVTYGIPAVPTSLSLKLTGLQATLAWAASPGAASYNVKRALISGGPYLTVSNAIGTAGVDAPLANGTTYYYVVSAVNAYGESLNSGEVSATTVAAGGSVYQSTVMGDHPIGYWPLDLSSDTNSDSSGNLRATDLSGNGNAGTYRHISVSGNQVAGPTIFLPDAVSFDGVTTYVDLSTGSNPALLNLNGKITLEAWVKPASSSTYGDIIGKGYDSSLNDDELEMRANSGNYHGGVYNGAINDQGVTGNSETTNWTYVVCTYDGADWNLYINGSVTTRAASTSGALVFNDPWAIGSGTADGLSRSFTGNLCDVALYASALTGTQISAHYTRGRSGQAPPVPTGLVATGHNQGVSLSWSPSIGATSYSIKRSPVTGGPYTSIDLATGTGYVDSGLANGTTYYYVVAANNSAGNSTNSSEINATPVVASPLTLEAQIQNNGSFSFFLAGQSNRNFVVETSTNLTDWIAILTNSTANGQFTFIDTNMIDYERFYRIVQ